MSNIYRCVKSAASKEEIPLTAIDRSIRELHRAIDHHHSAMVSILGREETGMQTHRHPCMKFSASSSEEREAALRNVIAEAIEVLEESRKAFKSKRLEALRKKLTNALIDTLA